MRFKPPFKIGEVVSNAVMSEAFKIGNMGGMRRSKATGTLVLINDHTKGLYDDKWNEDILLYTGMGKVGDQVLDGNQNKTLAESDTNGIEVHLFEVHERGKYIYSGIVKLADKPYQETQNDDNGNPRKVWIFPLKKVTEQELGGENGSDPDDVTINSIVLHKDYGEGIVTKLTEEKIYVNFSSKQSILIFQYPTAFKNGYLKQQ